MGLGFILGAQTGFLAPIPYVGIPSLLSLDIGGVGRRRGNWD